MFIGEAKVAALLSHPNIVQVFDFGKIDGRYYIAMEWIQGASLDRVLRRAAKLSSPASSSCGSPTSSSLAQQSNADVPGTR